MLTCCVAGILLPALLQSAPRTTPFWTEKAPEAQAPVALQGLNQALRKLVKTLLPAVVSLKVYPKQDAQAVPENHPPLPEGGRRFATGSGFIIRADGLILTNDHVVEDSSHIDIHLFNGETMPAEVLGRDPVGDLALLQITAKQALPVAPLGSSADLQVGEFVVAIGSPFGFEHTITFGIVSGKRRRFMRSPVMGGYIQTDASINTGNSGGPLINMRGEVVGINTAIVGRGGNLGFAIPIDVVKTLLPQLHTAGKVRRGWLGVQIRPLGPPQVQQLGVASQQGVYVHDVLNDQPAHQAGLIGGDIITRFDGTTVTTPADLQRIVAATPVGKTVQIQFFRQQIVHTVELTVGEMPLR